MLLDAMFPFLIFVTLMVSTPGPGNLTLLAIGQSTGFRSGLPFLGGCLVGMGLLNALTGFGLGRLVAASPALGAGLKAVGTAYILYLGWKILNMQIGEARTSRRFSLWEGCVLHPLSPKSWAMSLTGAVQFINPARPLAPQVAVFALSFTIAQILFHGMWLGAGSSVLGLLGQGRVLKTCNVAAAGLMVGATVWALFV